MLGIVETEVPVSHRAEHIAVFCTRTGDADRPHHFRGIVTAAGMAHTEIVAHLMSAQSDTIGTAADLIVSPPGPGDVAEAIARALGAPAANRADSRNRTARTVIRQNHDDAAETVIVDKRVGSGIGRGANGGGI